MPTNPDFVPSTVKEAVDAIVAGLSEAERDYIIHAPATSAHFFGGMAMRNDWSLWEDDTPLKLDAVRTYKIAHADDISGLILEWVWAIVREEPFDPLAHCQVYYQHWPQYGLSALQAGNYNDDGTLMTDEQKRDRP